MYKMNNPNPKLGRVLVDRTLELLKQRPPEALDVDTIYVSLWLCRCEAPAPVAEILNLNEIHSAQHIFMLRVSGRCTVALTALPTRLAKWWP